MRYATACAAIGALAGAAAAAPISITVSNPQAPGGFTFSPVWLGFHDGAFNNFDPAAPASMFDGITQIAELADPAAQSARFSADQPDGTQGVLASADMVPPFQPADTATMAFDVDASLNRYLSFASMVVPSNDLFFANDDPIELFDAGGNFNGPITISIFGSMVWDAGSEVNDIMNGPAFVVGQDAMAGADEGGIIQLLLPAGAGYLDSIVGVSTPDGGSITSAFDQSTLIATITIIPTPGAAGLAAFAALGAAARRRPRA